MNRIRLIPLILLVVVLAACSGNATPLATEQPAGTTPYPEAELEVESAYPDPVETENGGGAAGGSALYPDLENGAQIEWLPAFTMILNGEVSQVTQSPDLQVTLMLKDGRSFVTTAPNAEELQMAVSECGSACQDMVVTIE